MRPSDALRLLTLGAIWGSSFLLIKYGLEAYSPMAMIAARIIVGAVVLVVMVHAGGQKLPRDRALWRALVVMSIVANIVPFFLITWGEQYITSALTSILNSTTPLFTAIFVGLWVGHESFPPLRISGIVLGFAGVVVLTGQISSGGLWGAIAIVLASASYGIGFVYARVQVTGGGSPVQTSAAQFLISSVMCVPLLGADLAVGGAPDFGNVQATLAVLALGVVNTAFAYLFFYRLIADVGSTNASFVTYLIPVFGVFLGWIALNERLAWNAFVGAVMVIAGIAVAEIGARRATRSGALARPAPEPTPTVAVAPTPLPPSAHR